MWALGSGHCGSGVRVDSPLCGLGCLGGGCEWGGVSRGPAVPFSLSPASSPLALAKRVLISAIVSGKRKGRVKIPSAVIKRSFMSGL